MKTVYDWDKQIINVGSYVTVVVTPGSEDCHRWGKQTSSVGCYVTVVVVRDSDDCL